MDDMNQVINEVEQASDIASAESDPVALGAASEETQGQFVGLLLDGFGGLFGH
jgi:hypothetical protein